MELTDEVKKNITVTEVITDMIHYQKRINGLRRSVQPSKSEQQSIKDERLILDAKIIALANKISATQELKESLTESDEDSPEIMEAKKHINNKLSTFYKKLHADLLDATQKYAKNVARRLDKQLQPTGEYYTHEEGTHRTILRRDIGNDQEEMVTKIMSGSIDLKSEKLDENFATTPSAREAIILSNLANNCQVKGSDWVAYKDAIVKYIQELPAARLDKITEERNVSRIFKNAVNSICSVLGIDKPFSVSTKDDFKQRFQDFKEKAGIEEPTQDNKHNTQP